MHIVRGLGAPAPAALMVDPFTIPDDTIDTWIETAPGQKGHNSGFGCYCWGYRPAYTPVVIMGLKGSRGLGGQRWRNVLPSWDICPFDCPDAPCPAQATCPPQLPPPPPCPPPPVPAPCPTCPPVMAPQLEPEPEKFGINVGLVIAAVMAGGVGYYAYRRRKKKKR